MSVSPYDQLRQIIEQDNHWVDKLTQRSSAVKIYKRNHEKEIISFQFPGISQRLILKIAYVKGNKIQKFFRGWRKSLCKREYEMTFRFLKQGFAVPESVLYGEKRYLGFLQSGYYVAYEITDHILLTEYLDRFDQSKSIGKVKEKRKIIRTLGKYIGTMHAHFTYHGTLMPHHVLLKKESGNYQIYLIDLEHSGIYKKPNRKLLINELRKLNKYINSYCKKGLITRTDKLRFIKEYSLVNSQIKMSDFAHSNFFMES